MPEPIEVIVREPQRLETLGDLNVDIEPSEGAKALSGMMRDQASHKAKIAELEMKMKHDLAIAEAQLAIEQQKTLQLVENQKTNGIDGLSLISGLVGLIVGALLVAFIMRKRENPKADN